MNTTSLLDTALLVFSAAHVAGFLTLYFQVYQRRQLKPCSPATLVTSQLLCFGGAGGVAYAAGRDFGTVLVVTLIGMSLGLAAGWKLEAIRVGGIITWITMVLVIVTTAMWCANSLIGLRLSTTTTALLWLALGVGVVAIPSRLVKSFEEWEVILRWRWRRTAETVPVPTVREAPMVSIHVPAHAEPPDVVMATLDALARLDYPDYEVVVIDNNTSDESLWRPVEAHCARLGPRFRFLHVEGITGAKAGALNWARPYTDPRAELLGVVDADYQVDPRWLAETVGYFGDRAVGFVQCPHAYRDYESSRFTRMANAEYSGFFSTDMVALDEHGAGITVGTMSLIRLTALDAVGGWAEWCLTEDSELAIRIHAAGYSSVYLRRPYGWGLIPEDFAGYKKQRFRWTYGPVQEYATHARLFLPGGLGKRSSLTPRQQVHHANHGIVNIILGLRLFTLPLVPAVLLSFLVHHENIVVRPMVLTVLAVLSVVRIGMRWLLYRLLLNSTLGEFVGAEIAFASLVYTLWRAGAAGIYGKPVKWERTNKFRLMPRRRLRAIGGAWPETILATLFFGGAATAVAALPLGTFSIVTALLFTWRGVMFTAAPIMAVIADRELRKKSAAEATRRTADVRSIDILSPAQPLG